MQENMSPTSSTITPREIASKAYTKLQLQGQILLDLENKLKGYGNDEGESEVERLHKQCGSLKLQLEAAHQENSGLKRELDKARAQIDDLRLRIQETESLREINSDYSHLVSHTAEEAYRAEVTEVKGKLGAARIRGALARMGLLLQNAQEKKTEAMGDIDLPQFKQVAAESESTLVLNSSKFDGFGLKKWRCGDMESFDRGVEGHIGKADHNFLKAVYFEHCVAPTCHDEFTAGAYQITSTPCKEFWFVVGKLDEKTMQLDLSATPKYPEDSNDKRQIKSLQEILDHPMAKKAKLDAIEVLCGRLYTGPMFKQYNDVMRSTDDELKSRVNKYPTTIHVIQSLLRKLSRVSEPPPNNKVFRGMARTRLPKEFFEPDQQGCRGGVEFGFLSTSTDMNVALQYAGVKKNRPNPMIFEFQVGKTSMGSDVSFLSQFPEEKEILYPVLTHLEVVGTPKMVNNITYISLRPTVNQRGQTLDQIQEEMKGQLGKIGNELVTDMDHLLARTDMKNMQDVVQVVAETKKTVHSLVNDQDASWYKDTERFKQCFLKVVEEAQESRMTIVQSLKEKACSRRHGSDAGVDELQETISLMEQCIEAAQLLQDDVHRRNILQEVQTQLVDTMNLPQWRNGDLRRIQQLADQSRILGDQLREAAAYDKAQQYYDLALENYESLTMDRINIRGQARARMGKGITMELQAKKEQEFQAALDYLEETLCFEKEVTGEEPTLEKALIFTAMARVQWRLKKFDKGVEYGQESSKICDQINENGHHKANAENMVGLNHALLKEFEDAVACYEKSLAINRRVWGNEHPDVLKLVNNIGFTLMNQGNHELALKKFEEALKGRIKVFGEMHPLTADVYRNIGNSEKAIWEKQDDPKIKEAAVQSFKKALDIYMEKNRPEAKDMARLLLELGVKDPQLQMLRKDSVGAL